MRINLVVETKGNEMKVTVNGNQKEQIKLGIEPWEKAEIEISPATLTPEQRTLLAEGYKTPTVIDATPEAFAAALQEQIDSAAQAAQRAADEQQQNDEAVRAECARAQVTSAPYTEEGVEYLKFSAPHICSWVSPHLAALVETTKDRLAAEAAEKTAASRAAVADKIEAAKTARTEMAAKIEAAKAAINRAKFAKRLELGIVEISMPRGERKEWGEPWIAKLSSKNGKRPDYDFSAGSYDAATETLRIPCTPGEIIAYGQKNYRKASRTTHEVRKMTDDGGLVKAWAAGRLSARPDSRKGIGLFRVREGLLDYRYRVHAHVARNRV